MATARVSSAGVSGRQHATGQEDDPAQQLGEALDPAHAYPIRPQPCFDASRARIFASMNSGCVT
jgi:hypothetical protein